MLFQLLFLLQLMPENWWDAIKKGSIRNKPNTCSSATRGKVVSLAATNWHWLGWNIRHFLHLSVEMSRVRVPNLTGYSLSWMVGYHSPKSYWYILYIVLPHTHVYNNAMICIVFMRFIHTYIFAHGNRTMGKPAPRTRTHISLYHNSDTMYTNLCASDYTEIEITKERKASTSYSKVQVVWKTLIILGAVRRVFLES